MKDDPASTEEAVELFLEQRRRGDATDASTFAARHPELGPELGAALDALLALEHVTREQDDDLLPERIGPYRIVREIGRGGMGVVLEAIEEPLSRRVALKVLPPELLSSASARARFRREAELAARLDHSGIATVYGAGVEAERPWIAMRYVEGQTLARWIAQARADGASCVGFTTGAGRARALTVAATLARAARALHSAHEQGVVHRDVKPSNIIIAPDGTPVLLDFGLAITEESDGRTLTRTGETAGTPAYLAPENVSGERGRPDVQSDVYALGVTLFECLTLHRPFDAPTPLALYRAIVSGPTPDVRALNRDVPRDLSVVVATALDRDRARRYGSAAALAEDLDACAVGRAIAARPIPMHGRIWRWARREPKQALLTSLLAVATLTAAVLGGTWFASRDVVRAAETVARDKERDRALVEGYSSLLDPAASEPAFVRALALDPHNLEALAGRALVQIGVGRNAQAAKLLEQAPKTPGFDALRVFCGGSPITQDEALMAQPGAEALDFFLIGVGLSLEARPQGKSKRDYTFQRALAMLNEAVVRSPHALSFCYVTRALVATDAEDERAARSAAGALLALWPDSFHELVAAGTALMPFDPETSRRALERAVSLDATDPAPLHELGVLARDRGDAEACEAYMWRALGREKHVEIYNTLGVSYAMRGCQDEALRAWSRALDLNPRHENALLNTAQVRMQSGNMRGGIEALERLLHVDPASSAGHAYLGLALRDLGDVVAGRDHLAHAVALDGRRPDFWHELAVTYERLGEREEALETLDAALERHPAYSPLLDLQTKLEGERPVSAGDR